MYILIMMKTKIQKWGNSLAVRLPKYITNKKSLEAGRDVSVVLKDNQIIIEPVELEESLGDLLSSISKDNLHCETDWSDARGNEVW